MTTYSFKEDSGMRWFKIIEDGETKTAVEYDSPVWVRMKNGILLRCSEGQAQGILHYDGIEVFLLQGKAPIPGRENIRTAVEITMTEYEKIINEDYDDEDIPDPDPDEDTEEQMTIRQMRERIKELTESNEMLTECILEMSEIIYA